MPAILNCKACLFQWLLYIAIDAAATIQQEVSVHIHQRNVDNKNIPSCTLLFLVDVCVQYISTRVAPGTCVCQ